MKKLRESSESAYNDGKKYKYINHKDISTAGNYIRILPPLPQLNGAFFQSKIVHWFNKRPFISPYTFKQPCVLEARFEDVKADLASGKRARDKEQERRVIEFSKKDNKNLIPVIEFNYIGGKYEVIDDEVKILECGNALRKSIASEMLMEHMLHKYNGVEDGFCDIKRGMLFCIKKSGAGMNTSYTASHVQELEVDVKYLEQIPPCTNIVKANIYTDEYLNAYLDHVFEGADEPDVNLRVSRFRGEFVNEVEEDDRAGEDTATHQYSDADLPPEGEITDDGGDEALPF